MTTATVGKLDVWDAAAILKERRDNLKHQLRSLEFAVDDVIGSRAEDQDPERVGQIMRWADAIQAAAYGLHELGIHEGGTSLAT